MMRKATFAVTRWMGIAAGVAGLEHGFFEILQGNITPEGMAIFSIGPPCVPDEVWNRCEPAMTVVSNYLISGILSLVLGLAVLIWVLWFLNRKHGGAILIGLNVLLLLFGGGFFPPLIGIVGGIAGLKIHAPFKTKSPGKIKEFLSKMWPWPLVIFTIWILGQFPVGYLSNDLMQSLMWFGMVLIFTMLPLSVIVAIARDAVDAAYEGE
jgi:hypothetical protein